jgi:cation diffusion facilitator CzcD-associated flavoprotein CzcO
MSVQASNTRPQHHASRQHHAASDSLGENHTDVLIIGAGVSGIGLAYYLQRDQPGKRFTILESRADIGGTWDLFRYPGIRSDSDLYTFGYEFKPWKSAKAIADAGTIMEYLREAVDENSIHDNIRFHSKVISANWRSDQGCWQVGIENTETGEHHTMTASWLFSAAGYYRYDEGFTPEFKGRESFKGQIIHPQHWPEDLDYQDKKVVVIGSGATAVTLVPAMADKARHVTMLQRTPTYVVSLPTEDPIANVIKKIFPEKLAYKMVRSKNINLSRWWWKFCMRFPNAARKLIRLGNKKLLPEDFPVDTHFNPPYNPWEQRLCAVTDGDLFTCLSDGDASIVTDRIDHFTENGLQLSSGQQLDADIIITATGLNIQLFGGIDYRVDGQPVNFPDTVAYKSLMLSGVPNFAYAIGYTNSSWTLKIGLICEHLCRIMQHMSDHDQQVCQPELPDANMPTRPLLDFSAGYVQRAMDKLPRRGMEAPWDVAMDYKVDAQNLRFGSVTNDALKFYQQQAFAEQYASRAEARPQTTAEEAIA